MQNNIDGYQSYFNNKSTSRGGIAIYIENYLQATKRTITLQSPLIEAIFLEVTAPHNFIIGMIYRLPNSNYDDSLATPTDIIDDTSASMKPVYIIYYG